MTAFAPGLFERLMPERAAAGGALPVRPGIEQLKDSITRELDALLNTRAGIPPERLKDYPQARASILNYGLLDFAAYCLSSSEDRAAVLASLKEAIERFEPRLRNVSATLAQDGAGVNRLAFVIHATLAAGDGAEPVNFNAVLQPSTLHYAVSKAVRTR